MGWDLTSQEGVVGFVTYEGIYNDPSTKKLRAECYFRQIYHFHFINHLNLFSEVDHAKKFEVNIFGEKNENIQFDTISNLFHPITIDTSYKSDGLGKLPNIKTDESKWEINGHKSRIIPISSDSLSLFCELFEEGDESFNKAKLPVLHTVDDLNLLFKISQQHSFLENIDKQYCKTSGWNEVTSVNDEVIERETFFVLKLNDFIYSGPHFYVANPYYKTPREICTTNQAYDNISLESLVTNYIPRTNYKYCKSFKDSRNLIISLPWDSTKIIVDDYRLIFRAMIGPHAEKTLIGAIIPFGGAHINAAYTYAFESHADLLLFGALCSSLVYDSFVKIIGKQNLHNIPRQLPVMYQNANELIPRFLRLNSLTSFYEDLWEEIWSEDYKSIKWSKEDCRLSNWDILTEKWKYTSPLRNDYERRWALLEIDILTAMSLEMSLNELISTYNVNCPVMKQYENETYYDSKGKIVFTVNRGLSGVGFSRSEWNEIKDMQSDTVERKILDDTMPGGPLERTITYNAPFDRCDREEDYRIAWAEFVKRLGKA